jgi:hypothetical protein
MLSLAQEVAPVPVQGRWPDDDRENIFYQEGILHLLHEKAFLIMPGRSRMCPEVRYGATGTTAEPRREVAVPE